MFDSGQRLEIRGSDQFNPGSFRGAALADLDGDGDIDAVVALQDTANNTNAVYLNDGRGYFSQTTQALGDGRANKVLLGDLNGDGYPDAVFLRQAFSRVEIQVYLNNGTGFFVAGQSLGGPFGRGGALVDVNDDDRLDLVVAYAVGNTTGLSNGLYYGQGDGTFVDSMQAFNPDPSWDVAVGDLNGDNHPDLFFANSGPNDVWINDGSGVFTDSGARLGDALSYDVALIDVDDDNDLDAVVANSGLVSDGGPLRYEANTLWINNGGVFTDSGLQMGDNQTYSVAVGDLNGDGAADVYFANHLGVTNADYADQIWLNDEGTLVNSNEDLLVSNKNQLMWSTQVALADLDNDTDLDAFVSGIHGNAVWFGTTGLGAQGIVLDIGRAPIDAFDRPIFLGIEDQPSSIPLTVLGSPEADVPVIHETVINGQVITGETTIAAQGPRDVLGPLPSITLDTAADFVAGSMNLLESPSGIPIAFPSSATLAVLSESAAQNGTATTTGSLSCDAPTPWVCTICAFEAFLPGICVVPDKAAPQKGAVAAPLDLTKLRRLRDEVMAQSDAGRYYTERYYQMSPELIRTTFSSPTLVFDLLEANRLFTPAIDSVVDGDGSVPITPEMGNIYREIAETYKARGSDSLRELIEMEEQRLDPFSLVGGTAADFRTRVQVADVDGLFSDDFEND